MKEVEVSIITVCLNSSTTIIDTIDSVKSQSFKNYEHLIIDGGSVDGTIELVRSVEDEKIKVFYQNGVGLYNAMNEGIKLAKGKILGFLNSDDFFSDEECLYKIVNTFQVESCHIVHGDIAFVNPNRLDAIVRYWQGSRHLKDSFSKGWHPPHPSFYMLKESYTIVGFYREDLPVAADFDLMLRAFELFSLKSAYINSCLVIMRLGGESTGSFRNIVRGNISIWRSFRSNKINISPLYFINRFADKIKQRLS